MVSIAHLVVKGVGIWGVNIPVGWGFAIVNFVWWIGIGHAGTLISAILLRLKQTWRTSINRFAEAMTLFAVACAGLFPVLHLGRPWLAYWLFPYPNTMGVWPQFRSPLMWDVFAVSTYATVSLLFWYVGLVPDMATLRDRSPSRAGQVVYGMLAMGWRGSAPHWHRYDIAACCLPVLRRPSSSPCTPSSASILRSRLCPAGTRRSFRRTSSPVPFTPGFAMVLTLAIPIRAIYGLKDFITMWHLDNMAKILLVTGLMVGYGYTIEAFISWYSVDTFERFMTWNRMTGPYAPVYWALILCNIAIPQALWFRRVRSNVRVLFIIALVVNIGMWLERFIIVVTSLHRDFLPSAWGDYAPTFWDWSTFVGTIGLFVSLLFLFLRFLPMISIAEMRAILPAAKVDEGAGM